MVERVSYQYYLGIDGGGSTCRARLQSADGRTLGEGRSGPANVRLGQDLAWGNILASMDGALKAAGLGREVLAQTTAGFGLAGYLKDADFDPAHPLGVAFASLHLASDAHTACLGAFDGGDGAIQIIGTGSCGYAIVNGVGRSQGGWGFAISEKASGAALGRDAIYAALEASDNLAVETPFTRAVLAEFGGPVGAVDWSDSARPSDYAALAPMVLRYAKLRDPVALSLVRRMSADCATFILALVRLGAPRVVLLGGLAPEVRRWLTPNVVEYLAHPIGDALAGALLLARGTQPVVTAQTVEGALSQ